MHCNDRMGVGYATTLTQAVIRNKGPLNPTRPTFPSAC